jgi:deazaflavin-dependent oxidoreductase (nitroreductase family)
LDHIGRNSGSHHQTVLEVIHYDISSGTAVVMSGWGRRSDWYRNIQSAGRTKVTIGRETMNVNSRNLQDPEAVKVLADYERRNRLITPIVRRVLSQLAGFKYDGTESSRLALVQQLPLVEFTPSSSTDAP